MGATTILEIDPVARTASTPFGVTNSPWDYGGGVL